MKIYQTMTEYSSPLPGRGWGLIRIIRETGKDPDVVFQASIDPAVTAETITQFVSAVAEEHRRAFSVDVSAKCAVAALTFFERNRGLSRHG